MVVSAQARIRLRGIHLTRMPKRARTWLEITGFGTNLGDMGAVDRGVDTADRDAVRFSSGRPRPRSFEISAVSILIVYLPRAR
jgi:hypothetical protein